MKQRGPVTLAIPLEGLAEWSTRVTSGQGYRIFILAAMENWSVADMSRFLIENGFDKEVVELFRCNK